jgi:chromate transporter
MTFLHLFIEFFKTGLFAVGGGLATLPFLYDIADRYDWFTRADLANMLAISESTPGPIGVNTATYAGFQAAGIPGGILATLSLVLPSVIVILIIAKFLDRFRKSPLVENVFYGLRPAVTGMIAAAAAGVVQVALFQNSAGLAGLLSGINWPGVILFALLLFGMLKFKKHPIFYIAAAALVGIVLKF